MKIRNSQYRFWGWLFLLVFIIFFGWEMFTFDKRSKKKSWEICLSKNEESFNGEVKEVYISWKTDTLNVFAYKINVQGTEILIYNYCLVHPEAYIEKGDSIYKLPNSFEYHIYKGGNPLQKKVVSCEDNYCDKWR